MPTAQMQLTAFRVTNFRSVRDSGWIDAAEITALIGTNESGKTNLLLPLWKLNPAKEGEIKLLSDAPRKDYNAYRVMEHKPVFIRARFVLAEPLAAKVAALTAKTAAEVRLVEVSRDFDGGHAIHFPNAQADNRIDPADMRETLTTALDDITKAGASGKGDEALKAELLRRLRQANTRLDGFDGPIGAAEVAALQEVIEQGAIKGASPRSTVAPRFGQLVDVLAEHAAVFAKPGPDDNDEVREWVLEHLPAFVYYTTYGNLDTEIYLPHVIEDLKRADLTGKAEARSRTLRVLFGFVRLKPEEILELGKDWDVSKGKQPDEAQIQALNEKKKERSVLLQSAGTELTTRFREWWKQGEYRIRFEADGNHFRIWVSDDKRPEEIELEGRSTGLQWFLSFYLIFLVESREAHHGAILLLDEPGHSLHPLAQKDLAHFFESLADKNQIMYTTHSPFLVDSNHLDRVRAVFDVVLGNPPWERIKLQEQEWFAAHGRPDIAGARTASIRGKLIKELETKDPALHQAFLDDRRKAEGESHLVRDSSGIGEKDGVRRGLFPLCGRGDVNTYSLFTELNRNLIRPTGRVGCIVPSGIATDDTTKLFFQDLAETRSLASLFSFFEIRLIFTATDSRNSFCMLTMSGCERPLSAAEFVFDARSLEEVFDPDKRFTLSPDDLALLNPNTRTCPVFRTARDAELTKAIYRRVPVLLKEGTKDGNPWGVRFMAMLHMANDSGMFRTAADLEADNWTLDGNIFRKGTAEYLPLYEAKLLHQFDHRWATYDGTDNRDVTAEEKSDPHFVTVPRYWVPAGEVMEKLDGQQRNFTIGYRMAAMSIRKRTGGKASDQPSLFDERIPLAQAGGKLPKCPGVYLLRSDTERLFTGWTGNLQEQFESMRAAGAGSLIPSWLLDGRAPAKTIAFHPFDTGTPDILLYEFWRANLRYKLPWLNLYEEDLAA